MLFIILISPKTVLSPAKSERSQFVIFDRQ
nr:MAG TPA: hypothetical protein [Caudoviricetes sp.]